MTPTEKDAMALAVLDEWAGSCAECDGEGIRAIPASFCSIPGDFEDCDGCADIRQARAHIASRIAELEAEIETHDADRTACHDAYMGMEARATRAEAELAAVQDDRARLDWLESNKADVFQTMHSNEFAVQVCDDLDVKASGYAPTLRAAIDAARGGE